MASAPEIICFGELLLDMISTTTGSLIEADGFLKKFGGAPANTAVGLAKLGAHVGFIGKVGYDPFGKFLAQTLKENRVDIQNLIFSKDHKTTLAFVSLSENGERDFYFYRGAHEAITPRDVELPKKISIFHFGSLTQTNPEAKAATAKLIRLAKKQNAILSYDPNIRENLWGNLSQARRIILETAKTVDILKVNTEEALLLSGAKDIKGAAKILFTPNLDALFITMGAKGCLYKTKTHEGTSQTIKIKVVDTTGAGDAFNAGYLFALDEQQQQFSKMSEEQLQSALRKALIVAALTTTKKGAITAFPTNQELQKYL